MTDRLAVEDVLDTYVAAWNEVDPARRAALLAGALADDAAFAGPTGVFRGREAVAGLVDAVRSRLPGASVARVGPAVVDNEAIRFGWQVRTAEGKVLMDGVDEVELAHDGRLVLVRMLTGPVA